MSFESHILQAILSSMVNLSVINSPADLLTRKRLFQVSKKTVHGGKVQIFSRKLILSKENLFMMKPNF